MSNKKNIRFLAIASIIIVVLGIWIFKNQQNSQAKIAIEGKSGSDLSAIKKAEDLPLEMTSVDLEFLKSFQLPILIDFGADSCEPCKRMAPVLKKVHEDLKGKAIILFVDVWKNSTAANDFPIQVIPTQVLILADGNPYLPSEEIQLDFIKYELKTTGKHVFTVHQGELTEEGMLSILKEMGIEK